MTINVGDTVWIVDTCRFDGLEHFFDLGDVGTVERVWADKDWYGVVREDGLLQTVHAEHIAKVPAL